MELQKVDEALRLAEELQERKEVNRIDFYDPYPYQTTFHQAQDLFGGRAKQRLLMAANKVGKTFSGAAELAIHLTGRYPKWWTGHKFYRPIRAWAAGNTSGNTRDIVQAEMLGEAGDPEEFGKGALPKDVIISTDRSPGIPNALSAVVVKHVSGKNSKLFFKSYEQGKEQWMGSAVDCVWLDEEPPQPIYSQALRATLKTAGLVWMTFTPESGMTNTVAAFMNDLKKSQNLYHATWDDAPHLSEDAKEEILSALPPHERDMRSKGIPVLGSGMVFPIDEESIKEEAFAIPEHWSKICGIDFGWDHPFAAVWIAHDRDTDTIHVTTRIGYLQQLQWSMRTLLRRGVNGFQYHGRMMVCNMTRVLENLWRNSIAGLGAICWGIISRILPGVTQWSQVFSTSSCGCSLADLRSSTIFPTGFLKCECTTEKTERSSKNEMIS